MKTVHSLIAGLWPASSILARRIAFPLLFLGGGLLLAQPCEGAPLVFHDTGRLTRARGLHTATLLLDGTVLVAGGYGRGRQVNRDLVSTELYDPATGAWMPTRRLLTARQSGHTATLLADGRVLVVGGISHNDTLASAELYDPTSETWTETGSLAIARTDYTATLLPDGKVLVAGGFDRGAVLASAELYDPASGTWTSADSLDRARFGHTATLLADGAVLVAGGAADNPPVLGSAEARCSWHTVTTATSLERRNERSNNYENTI